MGTIFNRKTKVIMKVVKLDTSHLPLIEKFCHECKKVGYTNNSTLELMKWGNNYDLPHTANYWALIKHDEIISLSGSHSFGPFDPNFPQLRVGFRAATLPKYDNLIKTLSKTHMNSIPFSLLIPHQISLGIQNGYKHFFITTSHLGHDASGRMHRMNKVMTLLAKQNIVSFENEEIIYSTPQIKWRINLINYLKALASFEEYRTSMNLEEDYITTKQTIYNFVG